MFILEEDVSIIDEKDEDSLWHESLEVVSFCQSVKILNEMKAKNYTKADKPSSFHLPDNVF